MTTDVYVLCLNVFPAKKTEWLWIIFLKLKMIGIELVKLKMLSLFKNTILYLERNLTNGVIGAGCKPGKW